jgi:Leucine rich repeat N-terminal domain
MHSSWKALQIIHLKGNLFTGTISENFATLPDLSWFDVSMNHLHGTIPDAFVQMKGLSDFRVAGNMLYGDIPDALCRNSALNGGITDDYGCAGLLCPPGTYSSLGYRQYDTACEPCPDDRTSFYLGSTSCIHLEEKDILSMLYEVLDGPTWPDDVSRNWNDYSVSVCDWAGIECNDAGQTIGISFPNAGSFFN